MQLYVDSGYSQGAVEGLDRLDASECSRYIGNMVYRARTIFYAALSVSGFREPIQLFQNASFLIFARTAW